MIKIKKLSQTYKVVSILILLVLTGVFFVAHSQAASLTTLSDVLSRQRTSIDANHTITFTTPSGVAAGQTIVITFPSDFLTSSVDYTDIDLEDDGTDLALAAAASGTTWGAAFSGTDNRTLTFTSDTGTIAASSVITIKIGTNATFGVAGDQAINNPTANNTYVISITGTFGDTGSIPIIIIADDQVQVNADIYPTLEFSISSHSVGFGSISNNNIRYATADGLGSFSEPSSGLPVKLTAGTNAQSGLAIYIFDKGDSSTNAGLYSTSISELIPAAPSTEVINSSNKYGLYGKSALNLTLNEGFDNDGTADTAITTTSQTFASASKQVNGSVDVALIAATSAITKPGSYTDTLTLTCTGYY